MSFACNAVANTPRTLCANLFTYCLREPPFQRTSRSGFDFLLAAPAAVAPGACPPWRVSPAFFFCAALVAVLNRCLPTPLAPAGFRREGSPLAVESITCDCPRRKKPFGSEVRFAAEGLFLALLPHLGGVTLSGSMSSSPTTSYPARYYLSPRERSAC